MGPRRYSPTQINEQRSEEAPLRGTSGPLHLARHFYPEAKVSPMRQSRAYFYPAVPPSYIHGPCSGPRSAGGDNHLDHIP